MLKILIVDDEELVRLGIASKLKKSHFSINKIMHAQNAKEALQIIKVQNPDIVICDIHMEGQNGLQLSHSLAQLQPEIQIIIVSGYDEFAYAQAAIQIGVVDYLLKPIDTQLLYEALEKCIQNLQTQALNTTAVSRISKKNKHKEIRARTSEFLNHRTSDIHDLFESYEENITYFQVFHLYLDPEFYLFADSFMDLIIREYPIFELGNNILYYEYRYNEFFIAFCLPQNTDQLLPNVFFKTIRSLLHNEFGDFVTGQYTIGCSELCEDFHAAVIQAVSAMKHRLLVENYEYIDFQSAKEYINIYKPHISLFTDLRYALTHPDSQAIIHTLNTLGTSIQSDKYSYDSLQSLYRRLIILPEELQKYTLEENLSSYPRDIYLFSSIPDMLDFLKDVFLDSIHFSENPKPSIDFRHEAVQKVQEYVDRNYAHEFSLREISEMLHINYCYLSILFKEIMNINFRDYVTQVRIEHAKQYLASEKYKIKEVAALTGFSNQHYFSKMFKQITGMPPKEFKELQY